MYADRTGGEQERRMSTQGATIASDLTKAEREVPSSDRRGVYIQDTGNVGPTRARAGGEVCNMYCLSFSLFACLGLFVGGYATAY